jgi:hypothetical protein
VAAVLQVQQTPVTLEHPTRAAAVRVILMVQLIQPLDTLAAAAVLALLLFVTLTLLPISQPLAAG